MWLDPEEDTSGSLAGTVRYPNHEPESVSVQGLQGKGNARWGWGV